MQTINNLNILSIFGGSLSLIPLIVLFFYLRTKYKLLSDFFNDVVIILLLFLFLNFFGYLEIKSKLNFPLVILFIYLFMYLTYQISKACLSIVKIPDELETESEKKFRNEIKLIVSLPFSLAPIYAVIAIGFSEGEMNNNLFFSFINLDLLIFLFSLIIVVILLEKKGLKTLIKNNDFKFKAIDLKKVYLVFFSFFLLGNILESFRAFWCLWINTFAIILLIFLIFWKFYKIYLIEGETEWETDYFK